MIDVHEDYLNCRIFCDNSAIKEMAKKWWAAESRVPGVKKRDVDIDAWMAASCRSDCDIRRRHHTFANQLVRAYVVACGGEDFYLLDIVEIIIVCSSGSLSDLRESGAKMLERSIFSLRFFKSDRLLATHG